MTVLRVLIVEDNKAWQKILQEDIQDALLQLGPSNTYLKVATTFEEGWEALTDGSPWHLVVTDIALPPNNEKLGMELVEKSYILKVPVIVVSGVLAEEEIKYFSKSCKVINYFRKHDYHKNADKFISDVQKLLGVSTEKNIQSSTDPYSLKFSGISYSLLA